MRSRYYRSGNNGGGRHQNGQVSFNRNHVFESNGPNGRIRGTAQQLHEKYLQQGRDALSSGDRVTAESFFQYAEHYSRILNMINQSIQQRHRPNNGQDNANNVIDPVKSTEDGKEVSEIKSVENTVVDSPVQQSEEPKENQEVQEVKAVKIPPVRTPRRGRPPRAATAEKKKVSEENN